MAKLPKISIIIPSLNKGGYIEETLKSIVQQKYPNLELIIQDGGSTDKSLKIIREYSKKYGWIKYESKKDKGQAKAINKGFKKARGDILTFINADDVYEKGALKRVGDYFIKKPKTLWLAGKGKVIDKKGKEITKCVTAYKNQLLKINNYNLLLIVNYLMQPSVFLSRSVYEKYGGFDTDDKSVMEYKKWLEIGRKKMPTVLDEYLAKFRITENTTSSTLYGVVLANDYKIMTEFTKNPFILFLHKMHNIGRVVMLYWIKTKKTRIFVDMFTELFRDSVTQIKIRNEFGLTKLGSKYGGWVIPKKYLKKGSVCYLVGAGEDISFDCEIAKRYKSKIYIIDPTERARKHFGKLKKYVLKRRGNDYEVDKKSFQSLKYLNYGLAGKTEIRKFYVLKNPNHVLHSIVNLQNTKKYFSAKCFKLTDLIKKLGDNKINLMKLDVEGAEYEVIESIVKDNVNIDVICVEFDELHNPMDKNYKLRIKNAANKLVEAGYLLICVDSSNYTFTKRDLDIPKSIFGGLRFNLSRRVLKIYLLLMQIVKKMMSPLKILEI